MMILTAVLKSAVTGNTRHLGTLVISNTGEGTKSLGDYTYEIYKAGPNMTLWKQGEIRGFKRLKFQVWYLVYGILRRAFGGPLEDAFDAPETTTASPKPARSRRPVRAVAGRRVSGTKGNVASRVVRKKPASKAKTSTRKSTTKTKTRRSG